MSHININVENLSFSYEKEHQYLKILPLLQRKMIL